MTIDPKVSFWVNLVAGLLQVVGGAAWTATYGNTTGVWVGVIVGTVSTVLNALLHGVSAPKVGPITASIRGLNVLSMLAIWTAAGAIIVLAGTAARAQTVDIPASTLRQYTPEQIEQARQWARQNGVAYRIIPDAAIRKARPRQPRRER